MEITDFTEKHLADAAALVAARYRALRQQMPLAPARYENVDVLCPLLERLTSAAPGVVALHNGRLVGFLAAWLSQWRGYNTTYSPEWGNGADLDQAGRIYQAMYISLAARWIAEKHFVHTLTVLAHDRLGIEGWQWLGFGYFVIDAIRSLAPARGTPTDVEIRRASLADLDAAVCLERGLWRYLASAPTFLVQEDEDRVETMRSWLGDTDKALWLAHRAGQPLAYMRFEGGNEDACTVIRDEGTASITGAFTVESARGDGIATALLNRGLVWAQDAGYVRCSVDFEAMNVLGTRFWLRHFQPICYSLYRHVNETV